MTDTPGKPLDFGEVQAGDYEDRDFIFRNPTSEDLVLSFRWVKSNAAFDRLDSGDVLVKAHSKAKVAFRFSPNWQGKYDAIVELRAGKTFAGIVLRGTGLGEPLK